MTIHVTSASILAALLVLFGQAAAEGRKGGEAGARGKAIFMKQKCQQCHTVRAQGIGKAPGGGEEEKGEGGVAPPDLSGAGDERDAKWMADYLMKKTSIDGRKHKKRFKGNAEELAAMTAWLETLKSAKDSAKAGGKASSESGMPAGGQGYGQGGETGKDKARARGAAPSADSTKRKDGGRGDAGQAPSSGTNGMGGNKR